MPFKSECQNELPLSLVRMISSCNVECCECPKNLVLDILVAHAQPRISLSNCISGF